MNNKDLKFLRKRKFYLVLPLLVLPFVTLAFWAMGGGRNESEFKISTGLNLQLPDAKLKDEEGLDKLSFYNLADKDSLKNAEALRNDPNHKPVADGSLDGLEMYAKSYDNSGYTSPADAWITSPFSSGNLDANEEKIYKKVNELNRQINQPNHSQDVYRNSSGKTDKHSDEKFATEVDKLQSMMQMMTNNKEHDPEMEQISGMLEKILDIQHPDRIRDKVKVKSNLNKEQVFYVQPISKGEVVSHMQSGKRTMDTNIRKQHNGFYDLQNNVVKQISESYAIEAVIHQTQTVVSGSIVKLKLMNDIFLNGILIPKGNFIYGTASLENERLAIIINGIRHQSYLLPVALKVYDMDGLAGVHIPGSISRDVAKQSSEQSLQNIDLATLDQSLAAQAANTGIQAAKSLLTKKVKVVKVTLKGGYRVLLKDKN